MTSLILNNWVQSWRKALVELRKGRILDLSSLCNKHSGRVRARSNIHFSSPEYVLLKVSYFDRPAVCCPSFFCRRPSTIDISS